MTRSPELAEGLPAARAPALPGRGWRRLRPWLTGLGVTMLVAAAAWQWIVPPVAEAALRSWLRQQGLGDVPMQSFEVGLGHVVARNLRVGSGAPGTGALAIASVTAQFTLAGLWAQQLDTLVLDTPVWTMAAAPADRKSPFDEVLRRAAQDAARAPIRSLPALPVRHVVLRGGRIDLPAGSDPEAVSLDGALAVVDGQWRIALTASAGPQRFEATAHLQELSGAEPPQAEGALALLLAGPLPLVFEGCCDLRATAEGRVLTLALSRSTGAFAVDVADLTCTGEGAIDLHARLPFSHLAAAAIDVDVDGLDLSWANGVQIRSLATHTYLEGLPVPTSTGPQQVRWRSAQLGDVALGSGDATFDLRTGPALDLRLRQRTVDEIGSIDIRDLRLAQGWPTSPTTVLFDQVPLQACLELLSRGRITGEGRLSGTVELLVQTAPRLAVELCGGRLAAAPGGVVRFLDDADTEALVRQHAQHIAGTPGQGTKVQENLIAALKEFGFTALEFRIDAEGEGVTLRVHAAGAGRKVPQQLELDVNVHGFDTMVDTAIALKLGLDRAKETLSDQIDDKTRSPRMRRKP